MPIKISRQNLYLLILSVLLLIIVLLFSFNVLIPQGKNYREQKIVVLKQGNELQRYEMLHMQTLETLKELQAKNRHIIKALDTRFDPIRFEKQHRGFFHSLHLEEMSELSKEGFFQVYEVNTSSQIDSPLNFYSFLEAVNKSDWVIEIHFPIHFKRDEKRIESSFKMHVYNFSKELYENNITKQEPAEDGQTL